MKKINFITSFSPDNRGGGWNGLSANLFNGLSKHFEIVYVGPVNPGRDHMAKFNSKIRRLAGLPGKFHHFSKSRLNRIAEQIERRIDPAADFDFFHGATPWIGYQSPRPYGSYIDASFSTYLDIYLNRSKFLVSDVQRIARGEADWLSQADRVFCASQWAQNCLFDEYPIPPANFRVVWIGGNATIPRELPCPAGMNFLFIALDFIGKGGELCVKAFQAVRNKYPEATLTLVGEKPPSRVLCLPGVHYAGFFRKTNPDEFRQLLDIISSAFAIVHPTRKDTVGQALIEAAYYGCPAITTRDFGIPEIVRDGVSGFLIQPPLTTEAFTDKMLFLCQDRAAYLAMRRAAREISTTDFTWEAVMNRIVEGIKQSILS